MVDEAVARVDAAQRSMELYRLNYEFTKVVSPIDGQSSRYYMTLGNLVNQDQTLLTTVVSVDPMYVYFEVDEPTLLTIPHGNRRRGAPVAQGPHPNARLDGAARRGRLPAPGDHQLRQQPEQRRDGHHPAARLSSRTRSRRWAAGCSHPVCSRESACRSAYPTGRSWCVIGPSRRTRG